MTLKEYLILPFEKTGYTRIQIGTLKDFIEEQEKLLKINGRNTMQQYLDGALYEGKIEHIDMNDFKEEDLQRTITSIKVMNPHFYWENLPRAGMLIEII